MLMPSTIEVNVAAWQSLDNNDGITNNDNNVKPCTIKVNDKTVIILRYSEYSGLFFK